MIQLGVIGCGYWGPNFIRNLYRTEGCQVKTVCDLEPRRLEFIRKLYPGIETTTDYRGLLEDQRIDGVVLTTPVSTHYELARKALKQGKHVLVSKPLTQTIVEAEELIRLAEEQKRVLMVDHTFIYTGAVKKMRSLVESGALGDIFYFDSVRVNLGLFQNDVNVLWDLGPHDLSILDYVFGNLLEEEPGAISAVGCDFVRHSKQRLASVVYLALQFKSGMIAHVHLSWLSPVKVRRTLICGGNKMVVYDHLDPDNQVKIYDKSVQLESCQDKYSVAVQYRVGDMYAPKVDQTEALQLECQHFVDCIAQGGRPITDGAAGLRVVRVLEAAQRCLDERMPSYAL